MKMKVFLQFAAILIVANICSATDPLSIQSRSSWRAVPPNQIHRITEPVQNVIIHHTDTNGCYDSSSCQQKIRSIQDDHMDTKGYGDIAYNFLVAGDGKVYEGRGFGKKGSHALHNNDNSIGIAFIGQYNNKLPSPTMLDNAKKLIAMAVSKGYLTTDYTVLGHREVQARRDCPGSALFHEIKKW